MADEIKKDDSTNETVALKATIAEMDKKIEALIAKFSPKDEPKEKDILDKIKADKEAKEKAAKDSKEVEDSVAFNILSDLYLKENQSILPPDTAKIFEAANKEKYESQIKKTNTIKSALIQSFFRIQENMDMLTVDQKNRLDDFLKLTKDAKDSEAGPIYSQVMEPAVLMLKKIKKAQEVIKSKYGYVDRDGTTNTAEQDYENKLIKKANVYYLGKEN